jgi:hypothetical protein
VVEEVEQELRGSVEDARGLDEARSRIISQAFPVPPLSPRSFCSKSSGSGCGLHGDVQAMFGGRRSTVAQTIAQRRLIAARRRDILDGPRGMRPTDALDAHQPNRAPDPDDASGNS